MSSQKPLTFLSAKNALGFRGSTEWRKETRIVNKRWDQVDVEVHGRCIASLFPNKVIMRAPEDIINNTVRNRLNDVLMPHSRELIRDESGKWIIQHPRLVPENYHPNQPIFIEGQN
jgi:hypothetical protein